MYYVKGIGYLTLKQFDRLFKHDTFESDLHFIPETNEIISEYEYKKRLYKVEDDPQIQSSTDDD